MRKFEDIYERLCFMTADCLDTEVYTLPSEKEMCLQYGVSRQTLRRALARLKEEHIIESRQGSGYILTGLYPSRTNQIIVLTESDEVYLYPLLLSEVTRFFDRHHYQIAVVVTGGDTAAERDILEKLLQTPPRGLLAWVRRSALPSPNAALYQSLLDSGTAVVFPAGKYPNVQAAKTSLPDNVQGGYTLTQHLIRLGHTAIAMLLVEDDAAGQEKYLGYCRAMTQQKLPVHDNYVLKISPLLLDRIRADHTGEIISQQLSFLPDDTTALICQNDELAFTAIRTLESQGIRIPAMMSVAGFDCSYLQSAGHISLTTMQRVPRSEALSACETLMQQLAGRPSSDKPDHWLLVKGGSTGKPFTGF